MTSTPRRGLRQRLAEHFDRRTAAADAEAASHGLTVTSTSRYGRTYRDPRLAALAAVRAAGCTHVPGHLTYAVCDQAAYTRKEAA